MVCCNLHGIGQCHLIALTHGLRKLRSIPFCNVAPFSLFCFRNSHQVLHRGRPDGLQLCGLVEEQEDCLRLEDVPVVTPNNDIVVDKLSIEVRLSADSLWWKVSTKVVWASLYS